MKKKILLTIAAIVLTIGMSSIPQKANAQISFVAKACWADCFGYCLLEDGSLWPFYPLFPGGNDSVEHQ